jgi:hypothetical protein
MAGLVRFEPVETLIHGADQARLVFVSGRLGAVVVKLGDGYGELAQSWHAEAAFNGLESMAETTFPTLEAIEEWIVRRMPVG